MTFHNVHLVMWRKVDPTTKVVDMSRTYFDVMLGATSMLTVLDKEGLTAQALYAANKNMAPIKPLPDARHIVTVTIPGNCFM